MRPAQLTHPGLYPRWHLVRTPTRPMGPVGQALQPLGAVAAQPGMYGLAGDPVALGDQAHRQPVPDKSGQPTRTGGRRQRSAEPVTHHPRLVEAISRDTGNHQLTPMRKASPELAQELGGAVRRRSVMWGVLIRSSPRIKQGKHLM